MAIPQVTNATESVSQRCCDSRDVEFTLICKYTVWFRKRFHRLYGIEHRVLYLRLTRLSLGANNANTRLKTQVLCVYFYAAQGGTAFHRPLSRKLDLSVKRLQPLLAFCHAHLTRVITTLPAGLGYEV